MNRPGSGQPDEFATRGRCEKRLRQHFHRRLSPFLCWLAGDPQKGLLISVQFFWVRVFVLADRSDCGYPCKTDRPENDDESAAESEA